MKDRVADEVAPTQMCFASRELLFSLTNLLGTMLRFLFFSAAEFK
jgi:hypothetical protein